MGTTGLGDSPTLGETSLRWLRIKRIEQSQRDCDLQPKVARHELPWVTIGNEFQPQRGCGKPFSDEGRQINPKRISRPIRSRACATTCAIRPENQPCGDVPPVRRCIAAPVRDWICS